MTSGRRRLSKGELDLWRRATADVRPLTDDHPPEKTEPEAPKSAEGKKQPPAPKTMNHDAARQLAPKAPRALDPKGPVNIDRRNWERLKRGQMPIERTLDLHGKTQTEAHDSLIRFLTMASATGLRCVLVVTGKGGAEGRGVLRRVVPRWLGELGNREKVLTYCPAQPRHGGDGALYVLLRRRRDGRR